MCDSSGAVCARARAALTSKDEIDAHTDRDYRLSRVDASRVSIADEDEGVDIATGRCLLAQSTRN